MRVATFNLYNYAEPGTIYYGRQRNTYDAETDWAPKHAWMQEIFRTADADVIGFQEVFSVDTLRAFCKQEGYDHFATVETTKLDDDNSFWRPINAIASRFPFEIEPLPFLPAMAAPLDAMREALGIERDEELDGPVERGYSRLPVCARVQTPDLGEVTVLVLHLKSKRPMTRDIKYSSDIKIWEQVRDTMAHRSAGMIGSMLQRGAEAAAIHAAVSGMLRENWLRPIIVLGDINDTLGSVTIDAIQKSSRRFFDFNGSEAPELLSSANRNRWTYRIYDAFHQAGGIDPRPATLYFDRQPQVIDYIWVSNVLRFDPKNRRAVGGVNSYRAIDAHLGPNKSTDQKRRSSDHAIIVAEILPVDSLMEAPQV